MEVGSLIDGGVALARCIDEQGFDRRFDWYERIIRATHSLGEQLDASGDVEPVLAAFESAAVEADLFGGDRAVATAGELTRQIQRVALQTNGFSAADTLTAAETRALVAALRSGVTALAETGRTDLRF